MRTHVFKSVAGRKLRLELFGARAGRRRPAIVWFSGGGWGYGGFGVYERQCEYLAQRGMVAACAEFRAAEKGHRYSAGWAVEDARSAIRWLRINAGRYGVDPDRIAAAGESSGATMAIQTAVSAGFEAPGEPASVSSSPNALVLFDPAMHEKVLVPFFRKRMKMPELEVRRLIPNLNIHGVLPPSLLVYSLKDWLRPGLDEFVRIAKRQRLPVRVVRVPGQPHGFMKLSPWQERSLEWLDRFLVSLGYLKGRGNVRPPALPFAWGDPVFAGSLPTIARTSWFDRVRGKFGKTDRCVYQLSFAPLRGGRVAALVALKPGIRAGRALAERVRAAVAPGLEAGIAGFGARDLAVAFTEFPYRHVKVRRN